MPSGDDGLDGATPYGWTCPVCQASRVGIAGPDEHWQSKAIEGLKTHIRVQDDDRHGPGGILPARFTGRALVPYVEPRPDI